jgi:hypothetical protein
MIRNVSIVIYFFFVKVVRVILEERGLSCEIPEVLYWPDGHPCE